MKLGLISLSIVIASGTAMLVACGSGEPGFTANAADGKSPAQAGEGGAPGAGGVDAGTLPDGAPVPSNAKPAGVGDVNIQSFDGQSDDLLTAGLGKSGLGSGTAPGYANAQAPTAAELRKNAIWANYRALVDATGGGGFGTFFGPNVAKDGTVTNGEGKIAGKEYRAFVDDGSGRENVTVMAQIPDAFDVAHPCIVTGTSSGSRGVYGAIATAGEWGLRHGCAVAYTDKGTGNGMHDLEHDTVGLIDGTRAAATTSAMHATFAATVSSATTSMTAFQTACPHRVAYKHAHSQQNPEKDWGKNTLDAIAFAFYALNDVLGPPGAGGQKLSAFRPDNTIVIASSVSNGGGAALAAAEQDTSGVIDGIVVGEPQAQVGSDGLSITLGGTAQTATGKSLYDYLSYANLFQLCAALAPAASPTGSVTSIQALATARCTSLHEKGLLTSMATADQATESLQKLHDYGWSADADVLQSSHIDVTTPVVVAYANAYGRFSVDERPCGFSYAAGDATSGALLELPAASALTSFATGNGVPATSGVGIIYDDSYGGAKLAKLATSPSTFAQDRALDGDLCLRSLVTGTDPVFGLALTGDLLAQSSRVRAGIAEVQRSGNLRGKPAIIVQGRSDALLPVNHAGRAYVARNHLVEGASSELRYYEITNAQHLDVLAAVAGLDTRIVPLTPYLFQSLDLMFAHLQGNAALPGSQVVRTTPRGGSAGSAPPLARANVPAIAAQPSAADAITLNGSTLVVPQ